MAEALRSNNKKADALRSAVAKALSATEVKTAFDVFGSDLFDETFADVLDPPRERGWRRVDL